METKTSKNPAVTVERKPISYAKADVRSRLEQLGLVAKLHSKRIEIYKPRKSKFLGFDIQKRDYLGTLFMDYHDYYAYPPAEFCSLWQLDLLREGSFDSLKEMTEDLSNKYGVEIKVNIRYP